MSLVSAGVVLIMLALAGSQTAPGAVNRISPRAGSAPELNYAASAAEMPSLSDTLCHADRALYALAAPFTL